MNLITLDFETYYDKEYSLSKMTTEAYIRDPRFQVVGVSTKVNTEEPVWVSGPAKEVLEHLRSLPWDTSMMVGQNTMFDGAILNWRCGIKPKALADTMLMSRAVYGVDVSHSLKAISERLGIGAKGTEVQNALGKRRLSFTPQELARYGEYCKQDVNLTYMAFVLFMRQGFPQKELKLIDTTLRMFTEPSLDLDLGLLEQHLEDTKERKDKLLRDAGVTEKKDLMSNPKFAAMLIELGVEPPMKISPATGKKTYAFAKSDEEFKALQEHEDDRVQALVAARLGNKSTLEETRTERFIGISKRGLLPVPIKYYAAHTGRWGGSDKINLQNLPSRGPNGKKLKKAIIAPEGYTVIEADSSQIEARVLAWFAKQDDLTQQFARGEDVYKYMASSIYNVPVEDVTKDQRFVGKTTILGAGYGMGAKKFGMQLKTFGFEVSEAEAERIISIYRDTNFKISKVWRDANTMVHQMASGRNMSFGKSGVITVDAGNNALIVPSGLRIFYPDLQGEEGDMGTEYTYKTRRGRTKIYGGKVIENVCQAIARCVIGEQMLRIAKKYKVVLTVHDSIACCVPDEEVVDAQAYVEDCMRWTPEWAEGLPVDCESGTGKSYGDCE